jgi:hypothetical protein
MNWAWATSLDQFWRSPAFPMWLTLAAAGFFGIIVLVTLLRAEKSVANGALTIIALLGVGIAVAGTIRGFGAAEGGGAAAETPAPAQAQISASLPALSCIDDMAGETVLAACEKTLFGSAESVAAAVSYAASRLTRLTAFGDVAAADRNMTPELQALRHSVERDRYGLAAYVLLMRDHCTPSDCAAFRALTDHNQIVANMDERVYDGLIMRYAPSWNAPPAAAVGSVAALPSSIPSSMPTGRPTNAEFPSAASTPPISIMNPEPGPGQAATRAAAAAATNPPPARPAAAPRPAGAAPGAAPTLAAAAKKPPKPRPPVQVAPATTAAPASTAAPAPATTPAASNE